MSSTKSDPNLRLRCPAWLRGRSLTGRLTSLYVGSTVILLLLVSGYLYWRAKEGLARTDRALVTGKLHVLRILLQEQHEKPDALASEIEHEAAAHQLLRYYLRVLEPSGRVLAETSGMGGLLPVRVFPDPASLASGVLPTIERKLGPGRNYLLLAGEARTGPAGHEKRILHVALDMEHSKAVLAGLQWRLIAVLGSGTIFAALAGVLVARAGLRPLHDITRTTKQITVSRLHARLAAGSWPAELRELAGEFDAMLDRLQESFSRLTEFSADIAHAMRNPINNLRGETEVTLTHVRTPDEYRQTLASSLEELERLSRLIDGLLFIARADDPGAALDRVEFPVRVEMDAVREFYEALAAERQVIVTCSGNAALVGDPALVRRAISNLLANSLKYTPAGGRVTLAAHVLAGSTVDVDVSDTGCGISSEHLPRVFDRFFQVDKSCKPNGGGAGLGLAIVRSIMHLHGGEASIASTLGVGTTVTLRFPAGRFSKA